MKVGKTGKKKHFLLPMQEKVVKTPHFMFFNSIFSLVPPTQENMMCLIYLPV
jgi:hypothetical protein